MSLSLLFFCSVLFVFLLLLLLLMGLSILTGFAIVISNPQTLVAYKTYLFLCHEHAGSAVVLLHVSFHLGPQLKGKP